MNFKPYFKLLRLIQTEIEYLEETKTGLKALEESEIKPKKESKHRPFAAKNDYIHRTVRSVTFNEGERNIINEVVCCYEEKRKSQMSSTLSTESTKSIKPSGKQTSFSLYEQDAKKLSTYCITHFEEDILNVRCFKQQFHDLLDKTIRTRSSHELDLLLCQYLHIRRNIGELDVSRTQDQIKKLFDTKVDYTFVAMFKFMYGKSYQALMNVDKYFTLADSIILAKNSKGEFHIFYGNMQSTNHGNTVFLFQKYVIQSEECLPCSLFKTIVGKLNDKVIMQPTNHGNTVSEIMIFLFQKHVIQSEEGSPCPLVKQAVIKINDKVISKNEFDGDLSAEFCALFKRFCLGFKEVSKEVSKDFDVKLWYKMVRQVKEGLSILHGVRGICISRNVAIEKVNIIYDGTNVIDHNEKIRIVTLTCLDSLLNHWYLDNEGILYELLKIQTVFFDISYDEKLKLFAANLIILDLNNFEELCANIKQILVKDLNLDLHIETNGDNK